MISWPQDFRDELRVPPAMVSLSGRDHLDRPALFLQPGERAAHEGARRADQGQGPSSAAHAEGPLLVPLGRDVHLVLGVHLPTATARGQRGDRGTLAPLVYLSGGLVDRVHRPSRALCRASVAGGASQGRARPVVWSSSIVVVFIGYATAMMAGAGRLVEPSDLDHASAGGLGTIMFLNVWIVVRPVQKRSSPRSRPPRRRERAAPAEPGPGGRAARSWRPARTRGSRFRCSSSWPLRAIFRSSRRWRRWPAP